MIRKIALLMVLFAFAFFISGCVAPEYQFCCYKDEALDPDNPVCMGMNESGDELEMDVVECSEEDWFCTLEETYTNGTHKVAPICPNVETVPCNTTCAGIFCGSFFYDPRPLSAGYGSGESHAGQEDDDEGETSISGEPMGLWNAQCQLKNMSPLFLRQLENSDSIVMNKFRFGIGDTFQDLEDAQYFFPLTDRACYLNPSGSVDRYTVYALPGTLCTWSGSKYICDSNSEIESFQFYDCALRCNLDDTGYSQIVDPLNPYLSDGFSGEDWYGNGNPFYSRDLTYYPLESDGDARAPGTISFDSMCNSGLGDCTDYPFQGTILYGASFGYSHVQPGDSHAMMDLIAYNTKTLTRDGPLGAIVPRLGTDKLDPEDAYTAFNYLIFNQDVDEANADLGSRDVFFTAERSSQAIYPWLLAHHSVYNSQFRNGHYLPDGTKAGGAEFECLSGQDCLSGYCNNFDYTRGACVDEDGNDVLCDCKSEFGTVTCMGGGTDWMDSWDQGAEDRVELPTSRSAAIDYGGPGKDADGEGSGHNHWKQGQTITSLPSIGKVVGVEFLDGAEEPAPISGLEGKIPIFVMYIGGPRSLPDYTTRTWDYAAGTYYLKSDTDSSAVRNYEKSRTGIGMMLNVLNPCMVFPTDAEAPWAAGTPLSFSYPYKELLENDDGYYTTTKSYRFCCDGTTSCTHSEDETVLAYGVSGDIPDNAGALSTRFIENCMDGYTTDVHVCYNKDPVEGDWSYGNIAQWGWKMSHSDSGYVNEPLVGSTGWSLCHVLGEGSTYVDSDIGEEVECYQWKIGGAKSAGGDAEECMLQAETFIAIEPRWIEDIGRWAFGNCLLNENGDDLEVKEYGVCESCGYLTMAKQEITSMSGSDSAIYDPEVYAAEQTYADTYCPDLEISTPYEPASEAKTLWWASEDDPNLFYAVEPNGMNGYVTYKYGADIWGTNEVEAPEKCIYPNGYKVFQDISGAEIPNPPRGLPNILPNAYYVNKKLESMMKRNIQPVIFATDSSLWVDRYSDEGNFDDPDPPYRTGALQLSDGDVEWATFELFKDLYETRSDLFAAVQTYDEDPDTYAFASVYYNEETQAFYSIGSFLGNTILNEGAAVIVMRETPPTCPSTYSCWDSNLFYMDVRARGKAIRLLCPNCMASIGVGYGNFSDERIGKFDMQDRMEEMALAFAYMDNGNPITDPGITASCESLYECYDSGNCPDEVSSNAICDPYMLQYVDVISVNMALTGEDDYCSITDEDAMFAAIISNMTQLGSITLQRFGKPIIVTDFTIERSGVPDSCWTTEKAGRFMKYLGMHASDLSKSGYIGLIYGDWKWKIEEGPYEETQIVGEYGQSSRRDAFFEGAYVAARKFAGHSLMTYYMEVPEKETCECTPCTMADNPAFCNGEYLGDGDKCFGYQDGDNSKWPDNCITDGVCDIYGGAVNKRISCEIAYDNGTTETKEFCGFDIEKTPSGFRDVVSSMEDPDSNTHLTWCFPLNEGQQVTYQKSEHNSYDSLPAVFSMDGNTSIQCNPASGLMDSFCGYYPPITKYQMECVFTGDYCELGEEYESDIPLE